MTDGSLGKAREIDAPLVRDATDGDLAAVQHIYAHYVLETVATFEEVPPSLDEMATRRDDIVRAGLPFLVAERGGSVIGFSYASAYRTRAAYRHTVEDTVYVAPDLTRRGVGSALLAALIARCEAGPWRQMVAVIGDSANAGSIALHHRVGFTTAGVLRAVGFKHGRWVDTVLMQRALGATKSA